MVEILHHRRMLIKHDNKLDIDIVSIVNTAHEQVEYLCTCTLKC